MTKPSAYCQQLRDHYERCWGKKGNELFWRSGPYDKLHREFRVFEFPATTSHDMWTYATCSMSDLGDEPPIEIHLFSDQPTELHVELLTVVAYYHFTTHQLGLGHIVNFGRPWLPGSTCEFGLLSLPYLDGPTLEVFEIPKSTQTVRCLWLIPITSAESKFAKEAGLETLEQTFEDQGFNYLDPMRPSVV